MIKKVNKVNYGTSRRGADASVLPDSRTFAAKPLGYLGFFFYYCIG